MVGKRSVEDGSGRLAVLIQFHLTLSQIPENKQRKINNKNKCLLVYCDRRVSRKTAKKHSLRYTLKLLATPRLIGKKGQMNRGGAINLCNANELGRPSDYQCSLQFEWRC